MQPTNQLEDLLVGKTATVVGMLKRDPEVWRVSLFHPLQGYCFVDVKPQDVMTLHGVERRQHGANPYIIAKNRGRRD